MTLPQTWDWAESRTGEAPPATGPAWIAEDIFRPDDGAETAPETGETGETAPELTLAELATEMGGPSDFSSEVETAEIEAGEIESGEVELAEFEAAGPMRDEAFPSGLVLRPGTGNTAREAEHWDPNDTKLPLYATGASVRGQRLATNFTVGELVSSGGTASDVARISHVLVRKLQALRDRLGRPVNVSSGYRSWARNVAVYKALGKKPTYSRHCSGQAADINVTGMSGLDLAKAAIDACGRDIAIGVGSTYIHIDVRGRWARWSYATGAAAARDVAALDAYRRAAGQAPPAPPPATAPGGGSLRARIVQVAGQEASRWSGQTETASAMTATLQGYYRDGVGITVPASDLQSSSWQSGHPWSAVFISWVLRRSGAGPAFTYSSAHREYIIAAKRNAESGNTGNPFWAYPLEKVVPELGDLVCADRETDGRCGGVTYATIDNGTAWSTHCDVVTAVDRTARRITVIGGNVSNAVKAKTLTTDAQGFVLPVQSGQSCRLFAVIKVRDGTQQEAAGGLLSEDAEARANRLNAAYAPALGWSGHTAAIARVVSSPAPVRFARSVAAWQHARGLVPDGVLGPTGWTEMAKVLRASGNGTSGRPPDP